MLGAATTRTMVPEGVPINQVLFDKIRASPNGDRPLPETYLPQEYIEAHLAQFEESGSRIILKKSYTEFGIGKPDKGKTKFISIIKDINTILAESKGNINYIT